MTVHNKKKKNQKIVPFRNYNSKFEMNIGIVIFGIVFIYIIASIVLYLTRPHVSVYEIQEGTLIEDTRYTGLIIRDEEVVSSNGSGYIHYYYPEGSHVTTTSGIYSLSTQDTISSIPSDGTDLTDTTQKEIYKKIQSFNSNYSNLNFKDVYDVKKDITSSISGDYNSIYSNVSLQNNASPVYSPNVGNISYIIDGFETITANNFKIDDLDIGNYKKSSITSGTQISASTPIYKLVRSESWSLLIHVSDEDAKKLEEMTSIEVNILEDDVNVTAAVSLIKRDGCTFAKLDFDTGMIRYISNRYLEIELVYTSVNGLKIPISSVSTESFYEIPVEYVLYGGNSNSRGVLIKQEDGSSIFTSLSIYYSTSESCYALASALGESITIIKPDTLEPLTLNNMVELQGVYSVNKGYAIFECIEILASSEEYYIITNSSDWTIRNYDYIVLDGSLVEINDIVF